MTKLVPNYGFGEKVRLAISFLYTKLFWRGARIVRVPHRIRGKKYIKYGKGLSVGYYCRMEASQIDQMKPIVVIGKNVVIGDYAHIVGNHYLSIGDNVLIASRVFISDTSHGNYNGFAESNPSTPPNERALYFSKVEIGNNVWIGENVCILPGVRIGNGCIIGAGSIVTKSIPDNSIACGNPARIIKQFSSEKGWENVK